MTKFYNVPLIISEDIYISLKHPENFSIRMIDSVIAKGKNEAVKIFEVYNIDSPELSDEKTKALSFFQQGLKLYFMKKIQEAKKLFEKSLSICSEDKVSEIYIKRCDHYIETGERESWDGITRLDMKYSQIFH